MSEKEKTVIEKMAQLPPELQDKFVDKIDGAIMALDMLGKGDKEDEHGTETVRREHPQDS